MKYSILAALCQMISVSILCAQQLSPSVISSSGGFYSNGSAMLSFTTGEMASVETYAQPQAILTQGFQQPSDIGTHVIEHPRVAFEFGIYPNPSDGNVNLLTRSEERTELRVRITDLLGRLVFHEARNHDSDEKVHALDIHGLPAGMYLFTLAINTSDSIQVEKTTKIQIIE